MHAQSNRRTRPLILLFVVLLAGFILLQLVRPPIPNPPVTADLQAPPQVKQILRNSCYNCHSNETRLSWFDQVVPAYWLVSRDVKQARQHLNFSEIASMPEPMQKAKLFEAVNMIQLGAMPLPAYIHMHPEAAITEEQLQILRDYLAPPTPLQPASTADISKADTQYTAWVNGASRQPLQVQPEPSGFAFLSGYKNWRAISSTERFDNKTMRVILGNDVAIKAIAEHHINPWPDGAAFAKVTFFQQPDDKGFIHTGAFQQVELMLKDSNKYASTAGWGWGRWRGDNLTPYGKDAAFAQECVSCHQPVAANDFVFTMPLKGQQ